MPKINKKYNTQHQRNINGSLRAVEGVYADAIADAVAISGAIGKISPDKPFSFTDYPFTRKRVDRLLEGFKNSLSAIVVNGVHTAWTLANNKNNELCRHVFGDNIGKLSKAQYRRYFKNNEDARDAFLARKEAGLGLSDRVWNYTTQFKREIELGLDIGIRNGLSAVEMTKELRAYLKYPDKLFRRVRDEHGMLHLSKNAKAFHPGRGVYRSSFKNARRLTATETNMAYRTADHLRWQQLDFVVGIKIELSATNHPIPDICDDLKGAYPKGFKFVGWHPHCRCHAVPILKTIDEFNADTERILEGEQPTQGSEKEVNDLPDNFKAWLKDNKDKMGQVEQLPYFIADNKKLLLGSKFGYTGDRLGRKGTAEARDAFENHIGLTNYSKEQQANFTDIERELSVKRGAPMTFDEADHGKANNQGDKDNCAVAVIAHELRLRGFDITALPYTGEGNSLAVSVNTLFPWITPKRKTPQFTAMLSGNADDIIAKLEKQTSPIGSRYHFGYDTKFGGGHIVTAERTKNGLVLYDPQRDDFINIKTLLSEMEAGSRLEVLRVDRLLLNPKLIKGLIEAI